ncbi:hypothetical protein TRFO_23331 [Tritrichomonas foetus]|uniref:Ubiquitin-like domain-containing protein n=1 Tax=Tritrichomonas foetus TaxID=1144522 RepID=A0A1J4KBC1_9EUKA|nr:hypothetical protein TRFO_23331 [Tritrichomonas foetus]|eukprot:OHT08192.1 hypothetical protein TRFO_23331 [Tritrichomonas foetus]
MLSYPNSPSSISAQIPSPIGTSIGTPSSDIRSNSTERIDLIICSPHRQIRFVSAKLSGLIRSLQVLWPDSPKKFIYNGIELSESLTFDFYGIKSGESIIALPCNSTTDADDEWKRVTSEKSEFNELVQAMTNPKTVSEASRLRDLRLNAIEKKSRVFNKIKRAYVDVEFNKFAVPCKEAKETKLIIDTQGHLAPSEEPLPVLW